MYITYEIKSWPFYADDCFALRNSLFGAVKVTKNADLDKYPNYFGYGISLDVHRTFSLPNSGFSEKTIIFGVDMTSSAHIDNKKDFLILGKRKG